MAQLVEVHYRLDVHVFDFGWGNWDFSLTESIWSHYGPGINSAYNRNAYQD